MSYIDGFVIRVPADRKEAYREMAAKVAPVFKRHGAVRIVECWGNDLPTASAPTSRVRSRRSRAETSSSLRRLIHGGFELLLDVE